MGNIKNILITICICLLTFSIIVVIITIVYENKLSDKNKTIDKLTEIIKDDIKTNFNELKESNLNVEKKIDDLDKAITNRDSAINELYEAYFKSRYPN